MGVLRTPVSLLYLSIKTYIFKSMAQKKENKKFNYKLLARDIYNRRSQNTGREMFLEKAAEQAGVSKATLYRLEAEAVKPDIDTLASVCNWIGKPLQYYFQ
jgi:DNA-binding XRE family transcriptional regulator